MASRSACSLDISSPKPLMPYGSFGSFVAGMLLLLLAEACPDRFKCPISSTVLDVGKARTGSSSVAVKSGVDLNFAFKPALSLPFLGAAAPRDFLGKVLLLPGASAGADPLVESAFFSVAVLAVELMLEEEVVLESLA